MKVLENNFNLNFRESSFNISNVSKGIEPFLISDLSKKLLNQNILVILDNNNDIYEYQKIIKKLNNTDNILAFPSWDISPYSYTSPSKRNISDRFKILINSNILNTKHKIIITSYKALVALLPDRDEIENNNYILKCNNNYNTNELISYLVNKGYNNASLVLEPNEFSSRGGIIDIWPVGENKPYRLDFFGNSLESIKEFDPISQISKGGIKKLIISQNIEPPFTKESVHIFIAKYRDLFGAVTNKKLLVNKVKNFIKPDGIEHWMPLFYKKKLITIFDYFKIDTIIFNNQSLSAAYEYIDEINSIYEDESNSYNLDLDNVNGPINTNLLYLEKKKLKKIIYNTKKITFDLFRNSNNKHSYDLKSFQNIEFNKKIFTDEDLKKSLNNLLDKKRNLKKVIFSAEDEKGLKKLRYYLEQCTNYKVKKIRSEKTSISECMDDSDIIDIIIFPITSGFENDFLKVLTAYEIFKIKKNKKTKSFSNNILNISHLNINDYIAHAEHGIGKYIGLKTINIAYMPHDCLVIEYLNNSKFYLPVENINSISKYSDSSSNVILDKLGSSSWINKKNNVKKRIKDLANSLITQAAKRNLLNGIKINIDYMKLAEFEKGFKYIETEDQNSSLEEVYKDLQSGKPMDRLICGDVGFGKTEIALRTAFILFTNNLKTLVIVPTTLLANQHFKTFTERFNKYTGVEIITRNTKKNYKNTILENLNKNKSHIVISTHSAFSLDFSDINIGLIITDEEQHFGVLQKEKIKKIKNNSHLLTLSATPIPRTLHMSLIGIRDLSLIKTPPVDRKNIRTTVCRYEKNVIRKAISDEKSREGQIFLIVPRIKDIENITKSLNDIYPNLSYEIVHGKLKSDVIEKSMTRFYDGIVDLLISTSIVESGLDIPKANTLIVYKADNFGLAQLHQLRGRIGRSKEKGYAYFTINKDKVSDNAIRRLKALQAMDSLGAGINLANYDLDIRGAGNLLGEEQSGQIIQVGVELYQKLLKECVNDINNIKHYDKSDVQINIKLAILIPEHYIEDLSLRLSIYRKLGEISDKKNIEVFETEMINRFGPIPQEFKNLIDIMLLKSEAVKAKIIRIDIDKKNIFIYFNKLFKDYTKNFINWVTDKDNNIFLLDTYKIKIDCSTNSENELLHVYKIVNRINKLLNLS